MPSVIRNLIDAPGYGDTGGARVQNGAPAEIRLELECIGAVHISFTEKVSVADVGIGAGI
jgi:hypothetical protein